MPHFTTQAKLKESLLAAQVDEIFANITDADAPFTTVDGLITARTKYLPAAENDQTLELAARYIVIWNVTGIQQAIEKEEREKRKQNFDWAMETLQEIADGDIQVDAAQPKLDDADETVAEYAAASTRVTRW